MSRHAEIYKQYYPFRDVCPLDSSKCILSKCKYWVEGKVCWYQEFGKIIEEAFGCSRHDYLFFNSDITDRYVGRFHLKASMWYEEREDLNKSAKISVEIGVDSRRIAEELKGAFNLTDWEIHSRCDDGGDDHDMVFVMHATYAERDKVAKILKEIKAMIPLMLEAEKELNTCNLCKGHANLEKRGGYDICYACERRIIEENVAKYFKKTD